MTGRSFWYIILASPVQYFSKIWTFNSQPYLTVHSKCTGYTQSSFPLTNPTWLQPICVPDCPIEWFGVYLWQTGVAIFLAPSWYWNRWITSDNQKWKQIYFNILLLNGQKPFHSGTNQPLPLQGRYTCTNFGTRKNLLQYLFMTRVHNLEIEWMMNHVAWVKLVKE